MNIDYLADHEEVIPALARWFYEEWAYLHPDRTLEDVRRALEERTTRGRIPVALVAIEGKELLGSVSLKTHDMDTHLELTPWLAGLYVAARRRKQGIGTLLVEAIENEARELGVQKAYLHTPGSEAFYTRRGWCVTQRTQYHGYPVPVLEKTITL